MLTYSWPWLVAYYLGLYYFFTDALSQKTGFAAKHLVGCLASLETDCI